MRVCDKCGQVFDEPIEERDPRPDHFGHPCYETFWVSPCCHEGHEEAIKCEECGEYTAAHNLIGVLCAKCALQTLDEYYRLHANLLTHFNAAQFDFLRDMGIID